MVTHSLSRFRHPLLRTAAALMMGVLVSCGGGREAAAPVPIRITHDLTALPAQRLNEIHHSTFTGLDASGKVVYGPVRRVHTSTHELTDVPAPVETLQIAHSHATGYHLGTSTITLGSRQGGAALRAKADPLPNRIDVELVNDTDNAGGDSSMYVLFDSPLPASADAVTGITLLSNSGAATVSGQSFPLSQLATSKTVISPHTGKTRPVYTFQVRNVDSGRLSFSYGKPLTIDKGAAPTAATPVRYDKLELTFKPTPDGRTADGGGNLTAIDFHAIPLQVEVTHAGQTAPDPLQTKTFHASMPTLLKALVDMGAAANADMGAVLLNTSGGRFAYVDGGTDFSQFARVLSPSTLAADPGSQGSPAPYPSFARYLQSLVGKPFQINGKQHGGYRYTATVQPDGAGGFVVQATGRVTEVPDRMAPAPALPGPDRDVTVTLNLPVGQMDFFIYATVANRASYSVQDYPFEASAPGVTPAFTAQDKVNAANASAYGALVGDIQAVLNFGYLGGRFDAATQSPAGVQDISTYYASVMLPYAYPFGGARISSDGYYNPYAGLFYYLSDAYGHPYSDRLAAASPLYTLAPGDTVRITILNDNRLDIPLPRVSSASNTGLTVTWPTVKGATGYTITTQPASAGTPCATTVAGPTQTCTLTGLTPGTSYRISVTATGLGTTGVPIVSGTLPVQGMTTGTAPTTAGGTRALQIAVNLPNAPVIPGMQAFVNGQPASDGFQASIQGAVGLNTFGLQVRDASDTIVYASNYVVNLSQPSTVADGFFDVGPLFLDYNLTPLTVAGPPATPPYANGGGLVVGTPFSPKPYYHPYPTSFPK